MTPIEMDRACGLPVVTSDGQRLGAVTQVDACELLVEDELLDHPTYALNVIDVDRLEGGALHLNLTAAEALEGRQVA